MTVQATRRTGPPGSPQSSPAREIPITNIVLQQCQDSGLRTRRPLGGSLGQPIPSHDFKGVRCGFRLFQLFLSFGRIRIDAIRPAWQ